MKKFDFYILLNKMSKHLVIDDMPKNSIGSLTSNEPYTLFAVKQTKDKQPLFYDEVINGTATSTRVASTVAMATSTSGDYAIRQSKKYINYQPGKVQRIKETLDNFWVETNIVKRFGYFSSNKVAPFDSDFDGCRFSAEAWTHYVNIGKSWIINSIARDDWDDPLDWTWPSELNIDFSKSNLFFIEFLWLWVGSVRFGILTDYWIYRFHNIKNAGIITGT